MALATMKTACRPHKFLSKFSGKAEGAAKEAAAAAAETKAEEQPAKQETVSGTAPVAAIGGADGPTEIKVADKVDLWKPVISELQFFGRNHFAGRHVLDLYLHYGICRRAAGALHPLCMAHHPDDGQLLLEA